jgi:hypothetical protein
MQSVGLVSVNKHEAANLQHFRDFDGGNPGVLNVLKGRTGDNCIEVVSRKMSGQFVDVSNEVNVFSRLIIDPNILFGMGHPDTVPCAFSSFLATGSEFDHFRSGDFC